MRNLHSTPKGAAEIAAHSRVKNPVPSNAPEEVNSAR
jgi:hypothetical protein